MIAIKKNGRLVYRSRPTKRPRRTKAEIGELLAHMYLILEESNPMTVRQVFYQLTSKGIVEKTEQEYTPWQNWPCR
jgi:hypothetical protein